MKYLKNILVLLFCSAFFLISCNREDAELSKISRVKEFGFEGIADKIELLEADSVYLLKFNFNDDQIVGFTVDIEVGANSTATEDVDYALGAHSVDIPALAKEGVIKFEVASDIYAEADEKVYLTLSSSYALGLPLTKTIEITIKNVGGCPPFVESEFVGDYTVESDEWQDWAVGTVITVAKDSTNRLSFKYNCGAAALPILLNIDPATFSISGAKQQYCSYDLPPLTKFFADIVEGSDSFVDTCNKKLRVTITHTDENNKAYGSGEIVLVKK